MTMVKITVFLIRHGEAAEVANPSKKELPKLSQLYQPSKGVLDHLSKRLDPDLTDRGFIQAEESFRSLANALRKAGDTRKLALFSSPLKRCTASALMISVSGFEPEDWSVWGLTTPETQTAPTGIPICVFDGLCDCTPEMEQVGGAVVAIDAGLIHCAARPWNKAYKKDPIAGEILKMKDRQRDRIKKWEAEGAQPEEPITQRLVADVQYLRFEDEDNPYTPVQMSSKFNIVTELIRPNKIMDPPRKGLFESKLKPNPPRIDQDTLDKAVYLARKAGCDTVMAVVSQELITDLCARSKQEGIDIAGPGDIASFIAKPSDEKEKIKWKFHSISDYKKFGMHCLPSFSGPIEPSMDPPPDFKAAMDKAGEERWSLFPPPPEEVIPEDYPRDIPSFSKCLAEPDPESESWAWTSATKKVNSH